MESDQLGRLQDILNAARLIASYVQDTTESNFQRNTEKQDAVIRRLEIIGEAAVHLTEETRQAIPELPFRRSLPPNARHAQYCRPRLCQRELEDCMGSRHDARAGSLRFVGEILQERGRR